MVTSVHVSPIFEKGSANEIETFISNLNIVTDCDELQGNTSWTSFLTDQNSNNRVASNNNDRKYPIRVFTIQPEA